MPQQGLNLDNLPSRQQFYNNFNSGSPRCAVNVTSEQDLKNALQTTWGEHPEVISGTEKIRQAYCHVCPMNKSTNYKNVPCTFFYFWLGDTYPSLLDGGKIKNLMDDINKELGNFFNGNKCNVTYKDVDKTTFLHRKKIFDCSYDYKIIKGNLQIDKTNCNSDWLNYLNAIAEACATVRPVCALQGGWQSDSYCTDFSSRYEAYCDAVEHIKQKCESQTAVIEEKTCLCTEQESQNEKLSKQLSEAEANLSKATTTSSISSIFGTLAATAFPFLLYKYKPWSSWFGNRSSGNGSSRRSNIRRRSAGHEFDTLTENISTENDSILGSAAESSMDNSTVRSAAATYTGQPKGIATISNGPGHHRNLSYGRM